MGRRPHFLWESTETEMNEIFKGKAFAWFPQFHRETTPVYRRPHSLEPVGGSVWCVWAQLAVEPDLPSVLREALNHL